NSPAFAACTASPEPRSSPTTVEAAEPALSTSTRPTPTLSTRTSLYPAASRTRIASVVARESPRNLPRVPLRRIDTPPPSAAPVRSTIEISRTIALRSPRPAASTSSAGSRLPIEDDLVVVLPRVHRLGLLEAERPDLVETLDPVLQDALDACLQRHGGHGAA